MPYVSSGSLPRSGHPMLCVRDHHFLRLCGILPSHPGRPSILDLCASRSYDAASVAESLKRTVSRATTSERRLIAFLLLSRVTLAKSSSQPLGQLMCCALFDYQDLVSRQQHMQIPTISQRGTTTTLDGVTLSSCIHTCA
jgi:hypothetical protein